MTLPTSWRLVLALTAVALLPVSTGTSASASCAAPYLLLDEGGRTTLAVDTSVTVDGRAFVHGCDDTGTVAVNVFGCASQEQRETVVPMRDVTLVLKQGDRQWRLGVEDAGSAGDNRLGDVTWSVALPAGLRPGRATLVADAPPRGTSPLDARLEVEVTR